MTPIPNKEFNRSMAVQLVVYGVPARGLQDRLGRFIDRGHNGLPGSSVVAMLSRSGAPTSAMSGSWADLRSVGRRGQVNNAEERVRQLRLLNLGAVDTVLEREDAIAVQHAASAERPFRASDSELCWL
jgi:hypothetical protein